MNPRLTALQVVTDCLTPDQAGDKIDALHRQIISGRIPWENVVELANNHLLAPALWSALQEKGLTEDLPVDLVAYLQELHALSRQRNARLLQQLRQAVKALNAVGIEPVLLKGAYHLVSTLYGDTGVRIMSDIDLLVAPEAVQPAFHALLSLGYGVDEESLDDYQADHHHCPPLFRPGDYAAIEIHRELMEDFGSILSAEEALADSRSFMFDGLSLRVLSPTHRLLHNLLHSQLVDAHHQHGVIPLRSLYEAVVEVKHSPAPMDWASINRRMQARGQGPVLNAYLFMAHHLFALSLPRGHRATAGAYGHYLRCCAQLAWDWFAVWGLRWGRFSTNNIRRLYACGDSFFAVNWARLRFACRLVARRYNCRRWA